MQPHPDHPRIERMTLAANATQAFLDSCEHDSVQSLTYVPYSRFIIAKNLQQAVGRDLGKELRRALTTRDCGAVALSAEGIPADYEQLVKLATAVAHLVGVPNFDAMAGNYFARFQVTHEDSSDSYLRQAYRTMALHTDGTYVEEPTDWLLMMKSLEEGAKGGESRLLHLDDWAELESFVKHPLAKHEFLYRAPPSKQVNVPVRRPTFYETDSGICISFIDQFASPECLREAEYLHDLAQSLESASGTRKVSLAVGEMLLINNHFWLHGRQRFEENPKLVRELLRMRGRFSSS